MAQEQAALVEVRHVRENLRPPLSKPVTEVAARNMAGFVTYLRGDVAKRMGDSAMTGSANDSRHRTRLWRRKPRASRRG